jgi:hypothetical protein
VIQVILVGSKTMPRLQRRLNNAAVFKHN